jgi:hypothetical protein
MNLISVVYLETFLKITTNVKYLLRLPQQVLQILSIINTPRGERNEREEGQGKKSY